MFDEVGGLRAPLDSAAASAAAPRAAEPPPPPPALYGYRPMAHSINDRDRLQTSLSNEYGFPVIRSGDSSTAGGSRE